MSKSCKHEHGQPKGASTKNFLTWKTVLVCSKLFCSQHVVILYWLCWSCFTSNTHTEKKNIHNPLPCNVTLPVWRALLASHQVWAVGPSSIGWLLTVVLVPLLLKHNTMHILCQLLLLEGQNNILYCVRDIWIQNGCMVPCNSPVIECSVMYDSNMLLESRAGESLTYYTTHTHWDEKQEGCTQIILY